MTNFKGIDTNAGRNSIPQGFYQEMTNVDNTNVNRARHRQGLSRVTKNTLDTQNIVTSGEILPNMALFPESGVRASGSNSLVEFPHLSVSGLWALRATSGTKIVSPFFRQNTNEINAAQDNTSGWYSEIPGTNDYAYVAAGVNHTDERYGVWDLNNYKQQVIVTVESGFNTSLVGIDGIGIGMMIQPENDSWYHTVINADKTQAGSSFYYHSITIHTFMIKDGKRQAAGGQQSTISSAYETGVMMVEAEKVSTTQVDVKVYWNEVLKHTFSDTTSPLTSGYPGICATMAGTVVGVNSGAYPYHLFAFSGGSTLESQTGGLMGSSQPSGYVSATIDQQAHGKLHYHYVDSSGHFIILEDPIVEA